MGSLEFACSITTLLLVTLSCNCKHLVYSSPVHKSDHENKTEMIETPVFETAEFAEARKALHGSHFGGDIMRKNDSIEMGTVKDEKDLWPGGIIYYSIDRSLSPYLTLIKQAMQQYHDLTCIKFRPRIFQRNYVYMTVGQGCYSYIGMTGGRQPLSLGTGCYYVGTIVHELGHAVGLYHEHQREDRDDYIDVFYENVEPNTVNQFVKISPEDEKIITPYDYNSIMHYGNYAFSKQPGELMTMRAKNGTVLKEPYDKSGLDSWDVEEINKTYKCSK